MSRRHAVHVIALVTFALLVPAGAAPSMTMSAADKLHSDMRKLWEDHITWTRLYIVSVAAGLPDKDATAQRLIQNQVDIGNAIKPYYGDAAGTKLTELLKERLACSAPARIVITSSVAHYNGTLDLDDTAHQHGYSIMRAYARSKLANVLYARSLAAELAPVGVTVNAVHPGSVATDIWSGAPWYARPFLAVAKRRMLTPEEGGRALTYLAVSPDVEGVTGEYFDRFEPRPPSALAQDDRLGLRLREQSARLVGLPVS